MCRVRQGNAFKITITAKSNHHGTRDELRAAAKRCVLAWAKINGFDVEELIVRTRGRIWPSDGVQRVTAEVVASE